MIESYLIGSVGQSLERIRQLYQIVQGPYRREYDVLNAAWREFWRAPVEYQAWEAAQLDTLEAV